MMATQPSGKRGLIQCRQKPLLPNWSGTPTVNHGDCLICLKKDDSGLLLIVKLI